MRLKNPKQFIEIFNFTPETNYYDPIILSDEEIGFSIKRNYPPHIRFKPAIKQNGEPDEVIVSWLVYNLPQPKGTPNFDKVPIFIKINKYSLYRTKYFDYNFDDNESPTKESLYVSEKTPQPLELEYINDFFYNHSVERFIDKKGTEYTGIQMLEYVVKQHLNTVHILKGLKIRSKIFAQSKIAGILITFIKPLIFLLKHPFGRLLENSDSELSLYHGFKPEDMKRSTTDTIDIFGYRASKQVIFMFCIIIISIGIIDYFFSIDNKYLKYIVSNHLMMLTHSLALLIILDHIVPASLFSFINILIRLRNKIVFRKLKV